MDWQSFLLAQGAHADNTGALHFPHANQQLLAMEQGAVVVPLMQFGMIRLQGDDTVSFLQGQLSSDVKRLAALGTHFSTYSTPKGRMLASMLLLNTGSEVLAQLPRALLPAIQKRLSMYIMRSKTRAEDATPEYALLGLAGPNAAAVASAAGLALPTAEGEAITHEHGWIVRLPHERYQLCFAPDAAKAAWTKLVAAGATAADENYWMLSEIRAGIVWVLPATQEAFVPQMANMELIGAVNFKKGCYPGQEIVARTQYLGKLKRRAFRVSSTVAIQAGDSVYSPEMNGQSSGLIAMAAQVDSAQWEALAVVQMSSVEHGLHVQDMHGPALVTLPLPYSLDEAE